MMADPATERADTGTVAMLSRGELYRRAKRVQQLAQIAIECASPFAHRADPDRSARLLAEIGAIVGGGGTE